MVVELFGTFLVPNMLQFNNETPKVMFYNDTNVLFLFTGRSR